MEMPLNLTLYDGAILYRILYGSNYHGSVKRDPYSLLEVFSVYLTAAVWYKTAFISSELCSRSFWHGFDRV